VNDLEINLVESLRKIQQDIKALTIRKNNFNKQFAEIKDIMNDIDTKLINRKDDATKLLNELKELLMEDK